MTHRFPRQKVPHEGVQCLSLIFPCGGRAGDTECVLAALASAGLLPRRLHGVAAALQATKRDGQRAPRGEPATGADTPGGAPAPALSADGGTRRRVAGAARPSRRRRSPQDATTEREAALRGVVPQHQNVPLIVYRQAREFP